jgi:hypothetical protein
MNPAPRTGDRPRAAPDRPDLHTSTASGDDAPGHAGGSASAGCIADVYRSAGSVRLAVEAQLARRRDRVRHAGGYPTVTTTLPLACPSPRYRNAAGTSLRNATIDHGGDLSSLA